MILQSLNRYYDILLEDEEANIPPFGYGTVNVSFALNISKEGKLLDIFPLFEQAQRGKKTIDVPRPLLLPQPIKRASNIAPNFLWDNTTYVLGISDKDDEKPEYSLDRFKAFQQFHHDLLQNVDSAAAHSLLAFLESHIPTTARSQPAIGKYLETLLQGGNLVFQYNGKFIHNDAAIRKVWDVHKKEQGDIQAQCLITGELAPLARLHPSLKGVRGARSGGATLIGFNAPAYESYNRSQGENSPVSERATFGYSTILNYLLSDANPNRKFYMGDTTIVYWAESESRACEKAFASFVDPSELENVDNQAARKEAEGILESVGNKVKHAQALDLDSLLKGLEGENPRFYILGLSPNAARVSVRFFITDPFEKIADNIMAHYRDLEIVKEYEDQPTYLSVWRILNETVSKKSRDKDAAPLLAGAVFRSILTNTQYPAALYYAIINRIRADMDDSSKGIKKINYVRAAIIKAYLIRKYLYQENPFKEVLDMALNEQSTIPAYLLGRLFAVLEKTQIEAVGKNINATIKDRYFTSACASPASVFPILLRLSQHHIAKAEYGKYREWEMQEIMNLLDIEKNPIPARLTLDEQGVFVLGYYHQRAFRKNKNSQNQETEE